MVDLVWVLDCADPAALAPFWADLLGWTVRGDGGRYEAVLDADGETRMLLQRVPEPKTVKNRMHLDLRVSDMDVWLPRALGLGASVVRGPFDDEGWLTTVLADPQGNEFCLIVPPE
ncbi:VOC family protein [Actinomadura rayongensis]|uniref:VOC family protein n=1 Tax=Actinomadura rayongensis TaxID=1429076 RepID=UPI001925D3F0|nr:VOC family protein [Actinomadura rayongensis]